MKAVRKAKDAGRFGKMVMGTVRLRWRRDEGYYRQAAWRGTWAEDGGCLTNQTIHYIDLMTWIMGDIESVYARTATPGRHRGGGHRRGRAPVLERSAWSDRGDDRHLTR